MRYLSVCSGIEAATVAWQPLGWRPVAFSEIEAFPSAVLAHHYPDVPNLGDMTTIAQRILNGEVEAPDVLAGGTPCQAFSIAGLRKSLADERGNLTMKFVEITDAIDFVRVRDGRPPAIVLWENVPGVLSTKDNAFGCFLGALAGEDCELKPPGKRWADAGCVFGPQRAIAWRVLDAQYFGLAQRRRRVFVVASAREGFDPATVLFEFEGVRRDSPPRREAREVAPTIPARSTGGAHAPCLAFPANMSFVNVSENVAPTLIAEYPVAVATQGDVRRLTPRECERLMGFPDDYTLVPLPLKGRQTRVRWASDSARYKALGNSWAVPVVRWIGERIEQVHEIASNEAAA
ncbi:MAG: DNA cytosine methyltransferase [Gammaproteobacteria bacterium]